MNKRVETREPRYDVAFGRNGASIEPHFCREWDDEGGCYGTNPEHGMSLAEAIEHIADWHELQATLWRSGMHPDLSAFAPAPAQKDEAE